MVLVNDTNTAQSWMIIHTFLHIAVAWVKFKNTVEATLYLKYWSDSMYYMTVGTAMNINTFSSGRDSKYFVDSSCTAKIITWTNNCFNSILITVHNYNVWYLTESPTTQEESINSAALQRTIFIASYDCAYGKRWRELWSNKTNRQHKTFICMSLLRLLDVFECTHQVLPFNSYCLFIFMLWTLCSYIVWINTIHIKSCLLNAQITFKKTTPIYRNSPTYFATTIPANP